MKFLVKFLFFISFSLQLMGQKDSLFGSTYYYQKLTTHQLSPVKKGCIIFLGNSITDIGHWEEFFPNYRVLNRGISGDNTYGILNRLDEITRHQPSKVFIMIGINDIAIGYHTDTIISNYFKIISKIKSANDKTRIYVQSILPTNDDFTAFNRHQGKMDKVNLVNATLAANAKNFNYTYVDVHTPMLNAVGKLDEKYTNDGLHINGYGYKVWTKILKEGGYCCKD
jgi:lysophospholipase L1-like esterase